MREYINPKYGLTVDDLMYKWSIQITECPEPDLVAVLELLYEHEIMELLVSAKTKRVRDLAKRMLGLKGVAELQLVDAAGRYDQEKPDMGALDLQDYISGFYFKLNYWQKLAWKYALNWRMDEELIAMDKSELETIRNSGYDAWPRKLIDYHIARKDGRKPSVGGEYEQWHFSFEDDDGAIVKL